MASGLYELVCKIISENQEHPLCEMLSNLRVENLMEDREKIKSQVLRKYEDYRRKTYNYYLEIAINRLQSSGELEEPRKSREADESDFKMTAGGGRSEDKEENYSSRNEIEKDEESAIEIIRPAGILREIERESKYLLGAGTYLSILKVLSTSAKDLIGKAESPACLEMLIVVEDEIEKHSDTIPILKSAADDGGNAYAISERFLSIHYRRLAELRAYEMVREYSESVRVAEEIMRSVADSESEEKILELVREASKLAERKVPAVKAMDARLISALSQFWNLAIPKLEYAYKKGEIDLSNLISKIWSDPDQEKIQMLKIQKRLEDVVTAYQVIMQENPEDSKNWERAYEGKMNAEKVLERAYGEIKKCENLIQMCSGIKHLMGRISEFDGAYGPEYNIVLGKFSESDFNSLEQISKGYNDLRNFYSETSDGEKKILESAGYKALTTQYKFLAKKVLENVNTRLKKLSENIVRDKEALKRRINSPRVRDMAERLDVEVKEARLLLKVKKLVDEQTVF